MKRVMAILIQTEETDMKHTLKNQGKRAGITPAAVVAFAVLGTGTALAAPAAPAASTPTFKSAAISIEPRGEAAGGLTCSWRETGVGASQVVYYTCSAGVVAALKVCVYKNRVIYNSPTRLDTFTDVSGEHNQPEPFLSQKNGQINGSITTAVPVIEVPEGAPVLCDEPTVEEVAAVRWCNTALTDVTNNLVGAEVGELYQEFYSGLGTVPSCSDLGASP
jgi:hypothetical protein